MEDPNYVYGLACFKIGSEGRKEMRKMLHSLKKDIQATFFDLVAGGHHV
jgi:hypothetical protein